MPSKQSPLKEAFARSVLDHVASTGAVRSWLDTLAEYGGPAKKGKVTAAVQVSAAKSGLDFVSKFIGETGEHAAGTALLDELSKLETAATTLEEGSPQESGDDDS